MLLLLLCLLLYAAAVTWRMNECVYALVRSVRCFLLGSGSLLALCEGQSTAAVDGWVVNE